MSEKPRLKHNKAKCLVCGSVIESKSNHDFVWCKCGKFSVDGGLFYAKRTFEKYEEWEELSEYEPEPVKKIEPLPLLMPFTYDELNEKISSLQTKLAQRDIALGKTRDFVTAALASVLRPPGGQEAGRRETRLPPSVCYELLRLMQDEDAVYTYEEIKKRDDRIKKLESLLLEALRLTGNGPELSNIQNRIEKMLEEK